MVDVRQTVTVSGPIFTGGAQQAVDDWLDEAERVVAAEGVTEVRDELGRVLQNPTGYYESQVTSEQAAGDYAVTDSGVVYGPWLAGVGSRNATSAFSGYDHWPRATEQLQGKASDLAEKTLPPFLDRMNG